MLLKQFSSRFMKTLYTELCSILNPGNEVCNNYLLSAVNCTVGFVMLKEKSGSLVTLHKLHATELFMLIGNQFLFEGEKKYLCSISNINQKIPTWSIPRPLHWRIITSNSFAAWHSASSPATPVRTWKVIISYYITSRGVFNMLLCFEKQYKFTQSATLV